MSELDQLWAQMLDEAMAAARAAGRHDVADYLDLKARNDALRNAGVRWLFESLIGIAGEATRGFATITMDREDPHNFSHRGANIAGSLLTFRLGVRCLTVEAGWTRTPGDGFMRGGALAIAKISHFGITKMNAELHLKPAESGPGWVAIHADRASIPADESFLRQHFSVFLGE
ncbi:MAG: hypothetical protein ABIR33_07605 [Pyrinomonadaceae bacterium]